MRTQAKALSAGIIIVRTEAGESRYLLLRAYNYWDFPKGLVEPGEDPLNSAIREIEEETTLTALTFHWGHDYRETPPYGRGKVARYYIAESKDQVVTLPISPELGRPEHHEFRWSEYKQARKLLAPRVQPILDWAHTLVSEKNRE